MQWYDNMGKNKKRNQSTLRAGDPSSKAVFIGAPYEDIWLQFSHMQCDYTATDTTEGHV